ncbi:MAG TPA: HlyD family efflux transporter periplasmic adaptor subunit [Pirellulaceae bacterium]|nr:HlyD family efflux transporter periplasmic adaptor subunit [Pirellulaceae bacterium]
MTSDTLTSSSSRPLALAMRADLVAQRQQWQGREYWTIKDPLTLRYYRFEEEEFAILSMLDGQTSAEDICERFEERFAPQRIRGSQLQQLLAMLHRSNLLVSTAPGQGEQLHRRSQEQKNKQRLAALASFLALRFRGVDPDRFLAWLVRRAGWLFSLPAAIFAALLVFSAVLLVAAEFDTFRARLPAFEAFFAVQNWFWLAAVLCVTKILHELGHGLACKRFGGECHELGVMLLVFTPCLYCNVSDSWMVPSRWRRAAIGAAGMYIELILASLATFVWWFTEPGLVNHLALNVMFVCSVSTLVFNANPLMRFDGYYILADLLEIPNLRQKAQAVIQRKLGAWLLGLRERPDPLLPTRHQWLFAAYSVASAVYMWLVSLSIFWFLYRVLEPYGLKIVGQMLGLAMIFTLIVLPFVRLIRFLVQPARAETVNKSRAAISLGSIAAASAVVLLVPLPYYVSCGFEIQPREASSVYVDVPGELKAVYSTNGTVAAGQTLAELEDVEARLTEEQLVAQGDKLAARIEGIRQRALTDDQALLELSQTEEARAAIEKQLNRLRQDLAKLTIRAPAAGTIVPPPARPANEGDRTRLAAWSGRPLEVRNVGAYLEASTLLCRIAQPGQLEAILAIEQEELDFVAAGQRVELLLAQLPGEKLAGTIDRIADENMQAAPARLAARSGGHLATRPDALGIERPLSVVYQASVPLDDPSGQIIVGATGIAKIHAGYQPLALRLWRACCRTLRFEL